MDAYDRLRQLLLDRWSHLLVDQQPDGLVLIGHLPSEGEYAYFHYLLPPLSHDDIQKLESDLQVSMPASLRSFYLRANGILLFNKELKIYGMRKVQRQGTWQELLRQPIDIVGMNVAQRSLMKTKLLQIHQYEDESKVYIKPDGSLLRVLASGTEANSWPDLEAWLVSETERFSAFYNKNGQLLISEQETPPKWPIM